MALPINIEDLLNKRKIESNRIEFKSAWNPDKIYHTICAFATDLENTGGGYILVGVEEENGIAKRPVRGLPENEIDHILKDMVGYDAKIEPSYFCKVSPEEIDGKTILVIWVPTGANRPYSVMESVVAKGKSTPKFYVRSKSSTIEAKGEILDEVRELANRVPFDDRGNEAISINDISGLRVYEHLKTVGSKLVDEFGNKSFSEILDEMDLLTGPTEKRLIKNVAAMMFCDSPEKFFPVTQVDIVQFPEGSIENPDIMFEASSITGPVPNMIKETLSYLRTNIIKKRISKPNDSEQSDKTYNYPYQALEEAVVNALYHRDYREREPIEITIEPTHIDILSYAGPDRSISAEAIKAAKKLKARRYRNRRLGDFLKELNLTEGRATGIPTIQKALKDNGSEPATIETDENRTYFLITIPCRKDMVGQSNLNNSYLITRQAAFHLQSGSDVSSKELTGAIIEMLSQEDLQVQKHDNKTFSSIANQFLQVVLQVDSQVWSTVKGLDVKEIATALISTLYMLHNGKKSSGKICKAIPGISLYKLRRYVLNPLMDFGYICQTAPDKPTSSNQEYLLSAIGEKLFDY